MIPIKIRPDHGESLTGFLRRCAGSQGYTQLDDFLRWLGHDYGRPLIEELPGIAERLSIPLAEIDEIAPRARATKPLLEWRFQRANRDPFCPACLEEGQHWQQAWRICFVSACAKHELRLLDACERCRQPITPRSGGYGSCGCGYPLSKMRAPKADAGEVEVARLLQGERSFSDSADDRPAHPDPATNRILQFLASHSRRKRTGKEGKEGLPSDVAEAISYMKPVHDLLLNWPASFDEEVAERWRRSARGQTAAQRLGRWYQQLMSIEGPTGRLLQDRLVTVVKQRFGDPYATSKGGGDKSWLAAAQAARRLGLRAERLVAAVASGAVPGHIHASGLGHRHTVISIEAVEEIRLNRANYRTGKDLTEFLSISKKQLALLMEAGVIAEVPVEERPPLVEGRFKLDTIVAAVEAIASRMVPTRETDGVTVPFREISLRKTTDRSALLRVYRAIFDGQIVPVESCDQSSALGDICFRAHDVREALRSSSLGTMSVQDVSRVTGWKYECVSHWCQQGFLKAQREALPSREVWAIEISNLSEFQSKYVVVADLARRRGTTSRAMIASCERAGIPTFGSKVVGTTTRGHLLEIGDLVSALANH
ncbi:TniQ family protein [Limimaricola soesokkakensis]|uniref:TniQ family protein n=1 Tax=Limimaricola soesokkakensis TaxID=1343159 RepID=UPI003512D55A